MTSAAAAREDLSVGRGLLFQKASRASSCQETPLFRFSSIYGSFRENYNMLHVVRTGLFSRTFFPALASCPLCPQFGYDSTGANSNTHRSNGASTIIAFFLRQDRLFFISKCISPDPPPPPSPRALDTFARVIFTVACFFDGLLDVVESACLRCSGCYE